MKGRIEEIMFWFLGLEVLSSGNKETRTQATHMTLGLDFQGYVWSTPMHVYGNIQVAQSKSLLKNWARNWGKLLDGGTLGSTGKASADCRQRIMVCCLPHFGLCQHGLLVIKPSGVKG